jgi:hypothetical protein
MVKLVFLSSGVHQLIFSIKSTLPFAVGQVQDVGLIFLSAMATSIVETCSKAGKDSATTLGTVLLTLLLTTFLVGVLIILTGDITSCCIPECLQAAFAAVLLVGLVTALMDDHQPMLF